MAYMFVHLHYGCFADSLNIGTILSPITTPKLFQLLQFLNLSPTTLFAYQRTIPLLMQAIPRRVPASCYAEPLTQQLEAFFTKILYTWNKVGLQPTEDGRRWDSGIGRSRRGVETQGIYRPWMSGRRIYSYGRRDPLWFFLLDILLCTYCFLRDDFFV